MGMQCRARPCWRVIVHFQQSKKRNQICRDTRPAVNIRRQQVLDAGPPRRRHCLLPIAGYAGPFATYLGNRMIPASWQLPLANHARQPHQMGYVVRRFSCHHWALYLGRVP